MFPLITLFAHPLSRGFGVLLVIIIFCQCDCFELEYNKIIFSFNLTKKETFNGKKLKLSTNSLQQEPTKQQKRAELFVYLLRDYANFIKPKCPRFNSVFQQLNYLCVLCPKKQMLANEFASSFCLWVVSWSLLCFYY